MQPNYFLRVPSCIIVTSVRAFSNTVDDLEGWLQQWLQSIYTNAAVDTPSIPATISEDEYLAKQLRVFKGVNLAVKAERVEEPLASSSSSAINQEARQEVIQSEPDKSCENQHTQPEKGKRIPSGRPTKFPGMER